MNCPNQRSNNDNPIDSESNDRVTSNSIRLVVQRYRKASLLIDEKKVVAVGGINNADAEAEAEADNTNNIDTDTDAVIGSLDADASSLIASGKSAGHIGMLVYVSFSKTTQPQDVSKAAKTILNLPIQTEGAWGDGSTTKSIVQVAIEAASKSKKNDEEKRTTSSVSIILVPQANIIAKIKRNGKSVQYHEQIDKTNGESLYRLFVETIERLLIHEQTQQQQQKQQQRNGGGSNSNNKNKSGGAAVDASVPPKDYFLRLQAQQQGKVLYGTFDPTTGMPLTGADGAPLTKSAIKRIKKLHDAHVKRHEKYLSKQQKDPLQVASPNHQQSPSPENPTSPTTATTIQHSDAFTGNETKGLDPSFVQLVAGSFGKRQGLSLISDMGPFCHVIDL